MPNWCSNSLRVIGPKSEIDRFLQKAQGCGVRGSERLSLDFNKFMPVPEEVVAAGVILNERSGFKESAIFNWCAEKWGTKWNADSDTKAEVSDGEVKFHFQTAWAPPRQVVMAMAKEFPLLKFQLNYSEPGCGFAGTLICEHGVVITDECKDWIVLSTSEEEVAKLVDKLTELLSPYPSDVRCEAIALYLSTFAEEFVDARRQRMNDAAHKIAHCSYA